MILEEMNIRLVFGWCWGSESKFCSGWDAARRNVERKWIWCVVAGCYFYFLEPRDGLKTKSGGVPNPLTIWGCWRALRSIGGSGGNDDAVLCFIAMGNGQRDVLHSEQLLRARLKHQLRCSLFPIHPVLILRRIKYLDDLHNNACTYLWLTSARFGHDIFAEADIM